MFVKSFTLTDAVCFIIILVQIQNRLISADDDLAEINPCQTTTIQNMTQCPNGDQVTLTMRYFYDGNRKNCSAFKVPNCNGPNDDTSLGFSSLGECQFECVKSRPSRRLPANNRYGILSDFEITAPKKLSATAKRKFPLQLCNLQWDSGVVCPGLKRGSYMDQFYYDGKSNSCAHFVYNGCGGNANRFFSIWECIQSCVRKYHHDGF